YVPSPEHGGRRRHAAAEDPRGEFLPIGGGTRDQVVARPLIRAEREPPFDRFGPHPRERPTGTVRVGRTQPEQDRTRGVRSDQKASGPSVKAEEQVGKLSLDRTYAPRIDRAGGTPPSAFAVGDQFPGRVTSGPGDGRGRADQAPLAPRPAKPGSHALESGPDLGDG